MAKRSNARHGDVARHRSGAMGTIIDVHSDTKPKGSPPVYSVLPDVGPRECVRWRGEETEWREPGAACRRCHGQHPTASCLR